MEKYKHHVIINRNFNPKSGSEGFIQFDVKISGYEHIKTDRDLRSFTDEVLDGLMDRGFCYSSQGERNE